jgi:cell division septal protein FtsQ
MNNSILKDGNFLSQKNEKSDLERELVEIKKEKKEQWDKQSRDAVKISLIIMLICFVLSAIVTAILIYFIRFK